MGELNSKYRGLSQAEAEAKLKKDGYNELPTSKRRSLFKIIWGVLSEPMFILLVSCAVLYLILGNMEDALVLVGSVILVMAIDIVQEHKTDNALEALKNLSSPRALVIRDGEQKRIPGREVVVGDLIILAEGDRVPADAFIIENEQLNVDESLLTGESVPVRKRVWDGKESAPQPGGEDLPCVYSGTLVVSGRCIAQVYATGAKTELGKIGKSLEGLQEEKTKLSRDTTKLVKNFALLGLIICAIVVIAFYFTRKDLIQAFLSGITLAMSVLPEEFPVILTVFLALGALRLSRKNVLARRAQAIENLGATTVLCTDKTGTLTYNRMSLQKIWGKESPHSISLKDVEKDNKRDKDLLFYSVLACMKDPFDPMERAIHNALNDFDPSLYRNYEELQLVKEYLLTDTCRAMTNVWKERDSDSFIVAMKGSPETVMDLCKLDLMSRESEMQKVSQMAEEGLRVLGVGIASINQSDLPEEQSGFDFQYLGLIGLADPIRENVPAAVKECYRAGIRIIMITGDYVGTAKAIGRQIGLKNIENVITGSELEAMDDETLKEKVKNVAIFARVVPAHKLRIVQALKANNEVVAMTGDGVNDAPALKAANIGIAMGQRGTDVAREASAIVITDDDFSSIVSGVRMGRRIYDNLRKSFTYVFSLHVPISGMSIIPALFTEFPLIFYPVHIALLELIIDPACSIVFEMEKEEEDIMDRPPRDPNAPLFGKKMVILGMLQGLAVLVVLALIYFWNLNNGVMPAKNRAMVFTTMVFSNLMLITTNRSWEKNLIQILKTPNPAMLYLFLGVFAVVILATNIPAIINIFHISKLNFIEFVVCLLAGNISVLWFEIYKAINGKKVLS
ncbi:MAG: cation-translocating P-type ATPase [Candidatus Syntrophosphaera sp.]|jgi:Ca2+-transporting ATPase|nr:cation-translocating P-type ATPase [Candidatus Syntrophosphaera sp.]OQB07970.1 MAG: Calcium-transporting ATPase 1 [Candidatus Cloacimonetes bacterium ADurb.Bin211]